MTILDTYMFRPLLAFFRLYSRELMVPLYIYIGWTQKHSLISCSYKIKIYWNIFVNMGQQIVPWHLAVRTFLHRALAKHMDWPRWTKWPGVLQVATEITGPDRLWLFPSGGTWRTVYVPPLPATVDELQERITAAVKTVTPDMLQRVLSELDYRIDVCRVARGGHTECVWYRVKL